MLTVPDLGEPEYPVGSRVRVIKTGYRPFINVQGRVIECHSERPYIRVELDRAPPGLSERTFWFANDQVSQVGEPDYLKSLANTDTDQRQLQMYPTGYRDVLWCPLIHEPVIVMWKDGFCCPECGLLTETERHTFVVHIQPPRR